MTTDNKPVLVRVDRGLHHRAKMAALLRSMSLEAWINEVIENALEGREAVRN